MKKRLKYHYEIEHCYECGHDHKHRVYHYPKSTSNEGRIVRDIGPLLASLSVDPMPLTKLMNIQRNKKMKEGLHIKLKNYIYLPTKKACRAKSKNEVLRHLNIPVNSKSLALVKKIKK